LWLNTDDKEEICKFGISFKYTYDNIENLSFNNILRKIKNDISTLVNNRKQIMKLIPLHLKPLS